MESLFNQLLDNDKTNQGETSKLADKFLEIESDDFDDYTKHDII